MGSVGAPSAGAGLRGGGLQAPEHHFLRLRILASLWAVLSPSAQGPRARTTQGRGRHGEGHGDTALPAASA